MTDTVDYYNQQAERYAAETLHVDVSALHQRFLAGMPAGAYILDAGCGSGRDSLAFLQQGYRVHAFDASEEMARIATTVIGQAVQVQRLEALDAQPVYDGVWACASLLHVAAADLPAVLQRLCAALKPGGLLYLSMKHGNGERVDAAGRHFTDANAGRLRGWLAAVPDIADIDCWLSADRRADRSETWLNALVRRNTAPHARLVTGADNNRFLPQLCSAIARADDIDLAVSFVKIIGLRLLLPDLQLALSRDASPARVRIVTSDYLDITDPAALRLLMLLQERGGQVRVFQAAGTSFHLKAYLFTRFAAHRMLSGTAFIGSSNISQQALTDGLEWNVRVDYPGDQGFIEARARFEEVFRDARTVALSDDWIAAYDKRRHPPSHALAIGSEETEPPPVPTPFQSEALAALAATRRAGHGRGLVVLATGLGKTWLAAFDAVQMHARRVLFIAHREEILGQAAHTFARILNSARIGFYKGQARDMQVDVLCASVQTLGRRAHLERFSPDHFDYIIVDEFHHAAAPSYRRLLDHFQPRFLLGLTATPDRTDQSSILSLCDDNLVYRRDLFAGIEAGLLAPFHYRGIRDAAVDYREIPWRNGRFDPEELTNQLATRARARHALKHWREHALQRTLAFCVSIRHANYMAEQFVRAGIAAAAVYGGSDLSRGEALQQLTDGRLQILFSVDLFSEGVDLPAIDTILMLRPTESTILFQQQLGRGLRKADGKEHVVVLDFVGNHRIFLERVRQLLSFARSTVGLDRFLDDPASAELPAGCFLNIDLDAIDLLRTLLPRGVNVVQRAYRAFTLGHDRRPTIGEFYRMSYSPALLRSNHASWFDFVASERGLNDAEQHCLDSARDWFRELETTAMTKSYKMILLQTLIEADALADGLPLDTLARKCFATLDRSPDLRRDLAGVRDFPDSRNPDPKRWLAYWNRNPVRAWCSARRGGSAYFQIEHDRLVPRLPIPTAHADTFAEMTHELVDYQLAQYRRRLQAVSNSESFDCKLLWNRRDPILKLPPRSTHSNMPRGETAVTLPNGEAWTFRLQQAFCNVARPVGTDRNTLPDLLRHWFGLSAGQPGTAFAVRFSLTASGWQIEPVGPTVAQPEIGMIIAYSSLKAAAGALVERLAVDAPAETVALPVTGEADALFALRATGDSMAGGAAPIHDGDWVIFRHARDRTLSDIAGRIALLQCDVDGEIGLQIKRVVRQNGTWLLTSDNPAQPPLPATARTIPIATMVQHVSPDMLAPPIGTLLDAQQLHEHFGIDAPPTTGRVRGHLFIVLGDQARLESPMQIRAALYDRRPAETAFVLAPDPEHQQWRYCGVARLSATPSVWNLPGVDVSIWRALGNQSSPR